MYTVAAYLVEKSSGMPFAEFLQNHFFAPLGMDSSHLQPDAAIAAGLGDRIAMPYIWHDDGKYMPIPLTQGEEDEGAGSIFTSADDYIKYVKAMMNQEGPISKDVYRGIIKPRIFVNPNADIDDLDPRTSWIAYAAGWETCYYRGYKIIMHDGLSNGFGSSHFFLPELKFGAVILGNSEGAEHLVNVVQKELIDEVMKVPETERPDWVALEDDAASDGDEQADPRKRLFPDLGDTQAQRIPLGTYTGEYWNAGYRGMTVEIKDGQLFVDASDRSMGFYLTFEHICDQTMYIAHLSDYFVGGDDECAAEFWFEGDKVVKMGIKLEEELNGLIWFDKLATSASKCASAGGVQ